MRNEKLLDDVDQCFVLAFVGITDVAAIEDDDDVVLDIVDSKRPDILDGQSKRGPVDCFSCFSG